MIALRLALRELRGGLAGLRLLGVCLVLGVAALAGVGSLSRAITTGLSDRGQSILGGDIAAQLTQRRATDAERAALAKLGPVSEVVKLRAMTGRAGSDDRTLAEVKAVDAAYPLYGALRLANGMALVPGSVAVAPVLADRYALHAGDRIAIGSATFSVAGVVADEPDATGDGFAFGPRVLMQTDDLAATALLEPGSLFRASYRVRLPASVAPKSAAASLKAALPDTGWTLTDRSNGAAGTSQFVERLGQFLTLVGLTALVVAGVGVGNGVTAYLAGKSTTIAALKAMGAGSRLIFQSYLFQIGFVALVAVVVGAGIGAAVPWVIVQAAGDALPVPPALGIYAGPLLTAAAYGLLIAAAFAVAPLARARDLPAARLLRDTGEAARWPGWGPAVLIALAGAGIAGLAVGQSDNPEFAAIFVAAALGLLALLTALAALIRWLAARASRPRGVLARLALANLHRPGALTRQLVVALGLGLTLFATLSVIETNLAGQLDKSIPTRAPSFFAIDIPTDGIDTFRALVARTAPGATLRTVPSLRGPVTAVNGVPVAKFKVPEDAWILRGDRGLSYAAAFPEHNVLTAGKWWPADYAGPPLVSIDQDAATALGLKIGDTLTIAVLGVDVTARIASFRKIDWRSFGFNFAILFAPGTLEGAPHSWMATVAMPPADEKAFAAAVTHDLPTTSLVRVKDIIGQVASVFGQLSAAVRAAASVTVAAGIAVLIGALAASRQARIYDAVLLKVLGATRGQIVVATLLEYTLLAAVVAGLALLLGAGAGWYVVTRTLQLEWAPAWGPVVATVGVGAVVTVLLGLAGSWAALSARPNTVLRTL
ncbi:FtsX-like permease family protein [Polymorphobacter sp. PAMC 29334]|uniref:ABC transporter permease n=1 Tax=Polymorphobacter sp. PAMC 29334 TaxID=2862331 RepID=UPI001C770C80|nr:FtsX-like permease family protein [Polymorphobacter sp. PAMC 29334]QYE36512.1 FtsX-like permease family protein [Polymorphobacter sp. PAMC 29334]